MVKRCVVGGCSKSDLDGVSVHEFPKDPKIATKWNRFVRLSRKDWTTNTTHSSVICGDHFVAPDDFHGFYQFVRGFKRQLNLVRGAVPSKLPKRMSSETEVDLEATIPPKRRLGTAMKLACARASRELLSAVTVKDETDVPVSPADCSTSTIEAVDQTPSCTKSTQCDRRKPRRTKGVQAKPHRVSIGIQCSLLTDKAEDEETDIPMDRVEEKDDNSISSDEEMTLSDEEVEVFKTERLPHLVAAPPNLEEKYIVFKTPLLELFRLCTLCGHPAQGQIDKTIGTCIVVLQKCSKCSYTRTWSSQPFFGKMPAGNLLLSGAILFSGSLLGKVSKVLKLMNIASISETTFYRHQADYLHPTIINTWRSKQSDLIAQLRQLGQGLSLAGDARSDSPGHCAKYGSFTFIEQNVNKVLDIQLVQSNEVKNSSWCENEGLRRSVDFLHQSGLSIETLVTDRHRQNAKWIRENLQDTVHRYDVWHVAKGVGKKIDKLAKEKDCGDLSMWKKSITNHMYWCAASTPNNNGDLMVAKWESLIHHLQNWHSDFPNELFPACCHGPLGDERQEKLWLNPTSKAYVKLEKVLTSRYLMKDVTMLSSNEQTSNLEAFHSLVIQFAPKHTAFSYIGMTARLFLAGLHFNENSNRDQAVTKTGKKKFSLYFPKSAKMAAVVRPEKTAPTYDYAMDLMMEVVRCYCESPSTLRQSIQDIRDRVPDHLCATVERPSKEEAITAFVSRFRR